MLRTYLYLLEEDNERIMAALASLQMSKAELMRVSLREGLKVVMGKKKRRNGAEALVRIGEMAKKYNVRGPRDLSTNMNDYLWGNKKWIRGK